MGLQQLIVAFFLFAYHVGRHTSLRVFIGKHLVVFVVVCIYQHIHTHIYICYIYTYMQRKNI